MATGWAHASSARARSSLRVVDRRSVVLTTLGVLVGLVGALLAQQLSTGDVAPLALADGAAAQTSADVAPDAGDGLARIAVDRAAAVAEDESVAPVVSPVPDDAEMARLVAALAADDVRFNACDAVRRLSHAGGGAIRWLEPVLQSRDEQQRHLAAWLLRQVVGHASPSLCAVSVEALRRGEIPGVARTLVASATPDAVRWLVRYPAEAAPALRSALYNGDDQARFLAAFLLAKGGTCGDIPSLCRELIPHLGDNNISGDALMAGHALWCIGPGVLDEVRFARRYADAQASRLLDLIERDVFDPPRSRDELFRRGGMREVTCLYHDPVTEFDVQRSVVARW